MTFAAETLVRALGVKVRQTRCLAGVGRAGAVELAVI